MSTPPGRPTYPAPSGSRLGGSPMLKAFVVGFLSFILWIPALATLALVEERRSFHDGAVREIASKWGQEQTLVGPLVSVPYEFDQSSTDAAGKVTVTRVRAYAHFLPDRLEVEGALKPETRYRGIHEALLYESDLTLRGTLGDPRKAGLTIPGVVQWDQAIVAVGISDLLGVREGLALTIDGRAIPLEPGVPTNDVVRVGASAPLALSDATPASLSFSMKLRLRGHRHLQVAATGKETRVRLTSSWPSPSFSGAFLPERRQITEQGFAASWQVLHLNRNFPQAWTGANNAIDASAFGVTLLRPVDTYSMASRTTKYAILFIGATFGAFFVSEILRRQRVHPIQYGLIGFAVVLFYVLLLALSEHMLFPLAYAITSTTIVAVIAAYTRAILKSGRMAALVAALLGALYGFLYVVLQLEDYALLVGSVGLLTLLAATMYVTRRVDWYRANLADDGAPPAAPPPSPLPVVDIPTPPIA